MTPQDFRLTAEDFEQQPSGAYLFNFWIARQQVQTSFGDFVVEAQTPLNDTQPPDERIIEQANSLTAFVRANPDKILDKVYEHYQTVSQQVDWMQTCGVPTELSRDGLAPYLVSLNIVVDRAELDPVISVVPQWDEEHAIYLLVEDGQVEFQEL